MGNLARNGVVILLAIGLLVLIIGISYSENISGSVVASQDTKDWQCCLEKSDSWVSYFTGKNEYHRSSCATKSAYPTCNARCIALGYEGGKISCEGQVGCELNTIGKCDAWRHCSCYGQRYVCDPKTNYRAIYDARTKTEVGKCGVNYQPYCAVINNTIPLCCDSRDKGASYLNCYEYFHPAKTHHPRCIDSDGGINHAKMGVCVTYDATGRETSRLIDKCDSKGEKVIEAYCEKGVYHCQYKWDLPACRDSGYSQCKDSVCIGAPPAPAPVHPFSYGFGNAATNVKLNLPIPSGNYQKLAKSDYDDFKKGATDCYSFYANGAKIGTYREADEFTEWDEVCIKTGNVDGAGTNSNVWYWEDYYTGKGPKNQFCIYMDGSGDNAPWYLESFEYKNIRYYPRGKKGYNQYSETRPIIKKHFGKWLTKSENKNIVCWSLVDV